MGLTKIWLASRIAQAYNGLKSWLPPTESPDMTSRILSASVALWLALSGAAWAENVDPETSTIWQKVRADLFAGMPIGTERLEVIPAATSFSRS